MNLAITALYAGVLGLLFLALSLNVIRMRRSEHVGLGHDGAPKLERAIRAHANFAEYAPFVLLLMGIAELSGTADWRLHLVGGLLLTGRLLHAYCFACTAGHVPSRFGGMVLTFAALLGGASQCLMAAF